MQKSNFFLNLSALLVAISPLCTNYCFYGNVSIGDLFIILALTIYFRNIRINKWLLIAILISLINIHLSFTILEFNEVLSKSFLRGSFYLIFIVLFLSMKNTFYEKFMMYYMCFVFLTSILLIIQVVTYFLTGHIVYLSLPLKTYEIDTLLVLDFDNQGFRTGGIFKEPSYFSIYITPGIIWAATRKKYVFHSLLVFAGILSTSSLGIAISIISYFFYFINNRLTINVLTFSKAIFGFILFVLFLFLLRDFPGIDRFQNILVSGGTLRERFLPMFDVLQLSGSFFVSPLLHIAVSIENLDNGVWFNSFVYIISIFGWIALSWLSLIFLKLGFIFSLLFIIFLLTTHIFSTCFIVVFLTALMINYQKAYSWHPQNIYMKWF